MPTNEEIEAGVEVLDLNSWTRLDRVIVKRVLVAAEAVRLQGLTMTTYESTDGTEVVGEVSFVTGLEWFEDDDDATELLRTTWVAVEQTIGTHWPTGADSVCRGCGGEGVGCEVCNGSGDNPTPREGFIPDVGKVE